MDRPPLPALRQNIAWALSSLLLAPAALYLHAAFEWLFLSTSATPIAALPASERIGALLTGPLPLLPPLLLIQLAFSIAAVLHEKVRFLAVVPAAGVLAVLGLILIDNFTYTLFRFGVLTSGAAGRAAYAALLLMLFIAAGRKLLEILSRPGSIHRLYPLLGASIGVLALLLPLARLEPAQRASTAAVTPKATGASGLAPPAPNILFLGLDGLDAETLSIYGYERDTTPFLRQLAAESLLFENAFSNAGSTHGSLTTLLSGRLPTTTKVTFPPTILKGEDSYLHLPAILKNRGYSTLQLGMRHYADAQDANLRGGFDDANYRWEQLPAFLRGDDPGSTFRARVVERAETRVMYALGGRDFVDSYAHIQGVRGDAYWADERRVATLLEYFRRTPEPWFVHAHLLDTHCCNFEPGKVTFDGSGDPSRDARDNAILEADQHVRTVVGALRQAGQLERTLLVISSDHTSDWKTKGRVPLLVRFPGGRPAGTRHDNVQLADVAPTTVEYLGLAPPRWMDGVSLLRTPDPRPIFGISEVADAQKEIGPGLAEVIDFGPPHYGAASATVIIGSQWLEIRLADGAVAFGEVEGHTRAGEMRIATKPEAERLLRTHLERQGFAIGRAK